MCIGFSFQQVNQSNPPFFYARPLPSMLKYNHIKMHVTNIKISITVKLDYGSVG